MPCPLLGLLTIPVVAEKWRQGLRSSRSGTCLGPRKSSGPQTLTSADCPAYFLPGANPANPSPPQTYSRPLPYCLHPSGGSSRVRRSSFEPPFFVWWRPFTTSLAVLFSLAEHRPISIHYLIAQYSLVSVDQVRFCGELLFFSSSYFFFLFFFHIFFFFLSLSLSPGMGSVPGRAHFLSITLFFSSLLFPLLYTSFPLFYTSFFPSFFVLL